MKGRRKPKFRVLLVEDDTDWRLALAEKYQKILSARFTVDVDPVSSGIEAIRKLKANRASPFDLLSVDINLSGTQPRDADGQLKLEGADGRDVLRLARESKACKGVIVVTALHYDDSLLVILGAELPRARQHIDRYLQELFPERHLFFSKAQSTPRDFITAWDLTAEDLERISSTPSYEILPPYELEYSGNEIAPGRIVVRSRISRKELVITDPDDARFLVFLAKSTREMGYLGFEAVAGIYCGSRTVLQEKVDKQLRKPGVPDVEEALRRIAYNDVNNLRRRLRTSLQPKRLFDSKTGLGWYLVSDVRIKGQADASPLGGGMDPDHITGDEVGSGEAGRKNRRRKPDLWNPPNS